MFESWIRTRLPSGLVILARTIFGAISSVTLAVNVTAVSALNAVAFGVILTMTGGCPALYSLNPVTL